MDQLERLIRFIETRKPILWVGAGLSIPTISQIADRLWEEHAFDPKPAETDPRELIDAFQKLYGKVSLNEALPKLIPTDGKATPSHLALARLAKAGYFSSVITANYDNLLEKAFAEQGVDYLIQELDSDQEVPEDNKIRLYKIQHVILHDDSYKAYYTSHKSFESYEDLTPPVNTLVKQNPVLFLGCSMLDERLLNWIKFTLGPRKKELMREWTAVLSVSQQAKIKQSQSLFYGESYAVEEFLNTIRFYVIDLPDSQTLPQWLEKAAQELVLKKTIEEGGTLSALTLEGIGPAKKLHLELAERVNLLTGDNGLGKTFILECAWWALSGNWTGLQAHPREDAERDEAKISFQVKSMSGKSNDGQSLYNWEKQQWPLAEEREIIPAMLIYARADGGIALWDPVRDYWSKSTKAEGAGPLVFTRKDIWDGLKKGDAFLSNGLLSDWINWQFSSEKRPFKTLTRVLKRLSPPDLDKGDIGVLKPGKPTRIFGDSRWMPTIQHPYGEVPLVYASAGIRRVVALAYLIVWAWEEHKTQSKLMRKDPQRKMVIFIDEIEAHLHPQWQRKILPALLEVWKDLAPELSMQFFIATHSPSLMFSVEPVFDEEKDKIFHLDMKEHKAFGSEVVVKEADFYIRGSADSWLMSEIFGLAQPRSIEAENAMEDAKKLQALEIREGPESIESSEVQEVSERLMKYLSDHDRFWPRWTSFAEKHGAEL